MGKMKSLLISMCKVGLIGFGGGNALIPVIEQEVVKEKELITKQQYDKDIIAATLTPGALPVEIASGVGLQTCGNWGMVLGGMFMALPGSVLTILLLSVLRQLDSTLLTQIEYASIGITAFIMCLLTEYIVGTWKTYHQSRWKFMVLAVIVGVFILTAGKNIYGILQIDRTPVFGVSTVDALLVSFFAILFTGCKFRWQNVIPTMIIGVIYMLCVGKAGVIESGFVTWTTRLVMVVLSVYGISQGRTKKKKVKKIDMLPLVKKTVIWILFFLILSIPAMIMISVSDTVMFDLQGLLSSFMSFGGGDAYLTIADGLFVPHYIGEEEFYSHLVLIVNVLPGSILCKTLSGIGYAFGANLTGGMGGGFIMALAGFACSVAASCGVFHVIYHIYGWLERIEIFTKIKKSIRVIVSGLLLTVMAGLVKSGMTVNSNPELPWFTVLVMIFGIYSLNLLLLHKAKCKNLVLIGVSLVLSLGLCNIIGI
ncbi:MAG: chromate transporter [Eubacterium sp.]|nr:chromate transporter [Eubacterium sp.]